MLINLIFLFITFFLNICVNLFLTPFILKSLGDEAYGFVGLSNSIVSYVSVMIFAINAVGSRFVSWNWHNQNFNKAKIYYSSILITNISFVVAVIFLCVIFILNLNHFFKIAYYLVDDVRLTFLFYFINFCVILFVGVIQIPAFVENKLYLMSMRNSSAIIIYAILILILFYFFEPTIYYIAISALVSSIFMLIASVFISKKINLDLNFNFLNFNILAIKDIFKSGIFNGFNAFNRVILTGMDLLICNIFLPANMLGILAVSKSIVLIFDGLVIQMGAMFIPKFIKIDSNKNNFKLLKEIKFVSRLISILIGVPLASFIILSKDFYSLWLSFKSKEEIELVHNISLILVLPIVLNLQIISIYSSDLIKNFFKRTAFFNGFLSIFALFTEIILLQHYPNIFIIVTVLSIFLIFRILSFDMINAALNFKIPKISFYSLFFKNIFLFILVLGIFYILKFEINSWLSFSLNFLMFLIIGYLFLFILNIKKHEKKILKKIFRKKIKI